MHILDGNLGPHTYLPATAAMVVFWATASAQLKRTLRMRHVPLLALAAAFSFVIMMFNVPILGGTSGHAAGGVLIAVVLGPWAAVVAVSLALIVQAVLFGDGGITAIGANCFNLAVVMPFVGWWTYRLIAGRAPQTARRQGLGAAVGGYVGISAAAFTTAVMLGIQPAIARDAAGHALYFPFGLAVTIPALTLEHLLIFGFVEAAVTGMVVAYLHRAAPEILAGPSRNEALPPWRRLAVGLGVLVLLSPLGIYLPAALGAGAAWGEWSGSELQQEYERVHGPGTGYIPHGVQQAEDTGWKALLPDYAFPGHAAASLPVQSLVYILAGLLGAGIVGLLVMSLRRPLAAKDGPDGAPNVDA
jgi:cobalt/nickel transport system permease protein